MCAIISSQSLVSQVIGWLTKPAAALSVLMPLMKQEGCSDSVLDQKAGVWPIDTSLPSLTLTLSFLFKMSRWVTACPTLWGSLARCGTGLPGSRLLYHNGAVVWDLWWLPSIWVNTAAIFHHQLLSQNVSVRVRSFGLTWAGPCSPVDSSGW